MASSDDIMMALGRLTESVEQLREDFRDEKQTAHESRAVIHRRLDEQAAEIGSLKTNVAVAGLVEAQVRDEIKALGVRVEENHKAVTPSVEEWKRIRNIGIGITGLVAIGGLSVGAVLTWASETAVTTIRHWLRIA
ncbi:DUF1515 domain-containing protein [Sinorhizobium meliloti]|nr:DUF1515 domain-containing protein [Sinorhizobium meliloti]